MNDKKRTTEDLDQWDAWAQETYQTGSTKPPKSYGGIIAFLMGLVIFLCGTSTALGLMNIHLFRQLNTQPTETSYPLAFSYSMEETSAEDPASVDFSLGFTGQTVPEFWNLYQDLPLGVYITDVTDSSDAAQKGLHPGDILTQVNHMPTPDTQTLQEVLDACLSGETVDAVIYRSGQQIKLTLAVE